ncbi:hypothetical protein GOP47_0003637 [Adiantum capillus-veneris]|uniref:Uncharacterized protein n=1 Tax=Adiantum capillus-veneris TaxID=13818 RepID=A0A9D4ZM23_ADICA|nr:hypothetical protein GOP47_0003637 [Adiantum capillus-veneris]
MLKRVTERLPTELQAGVEFSLIGECMPQHLAHHQDSPLLLSRAPIDSGDKRPLESCFCSPKEEGYSRAAHKHHLRGESPRKCRADSFPRNLSRMPNGFQIWEELKNKDRLTSGTWIEVSVSKLNSSTPQVHTLTVQGNSCLPDFHLILYEQPNLGSHHFSTQPWTFVAHSNQVRECQKEAHQKADWVLELEKRQEAPDIDLVVLQLNCAVAAEHCVEHLVPSFDTPCKGLSLSSIVTPVYRHTVAATIALFATMYFVVVQTVSCLLKMWPFLHLNVLLAKFMKLTHRNIRIRCYELIGWPVILLWRGCRRDQPNIAAAHRTALIRHSTWSAISFDLAFGLVWGVFFLSYQSAISFQIRAMVQGLTDDILRTGCIWLMGVPAGFKLNTELAGMLGLFSLNVIQVWSTLVYLLKPLFGPFLCMLAVTGMFLGITVPAAIIADMLFLVTFHISTLHQMVAFMYSNQLQALAALWRLFRGRKRNTLRGRIDTYDCSIEQHVVGSLMFTPLLLLLPTTSVFYIFFTMLFTSLSILRFSLQIFVAIVHCFPYAQVAIWLVQPRRFPSGIWLETLPEGRVPQCGIQQLMGQGKPRGQRKGFSVPAAAQVLVTRLGIKTATIGEILVPYLRQLSGGFTWSSCALCIYKIFSGERWPASVELGTPVLPPWTSVNLLMYNSAIEQLSMRKSKQQHLVCLRWPYHGNMWYDT